MRKTGFLTCFLVLALALAVPAFAAKVVLKLGHIAEPVHPYGRARNTSPSWWRKRPAARWKSSLSLLPAGSQKDLIEGLIFGTWTWP
jgi:hypothetical protein